MSWVERAACAGMAPEFDTDFIDTWHVAVCSMCPVASDCLLEGLSLRRSEDFGIWGGTDKGQRQLIRRGLVTVHDVWQQNMESACQPCGLPSES